MRRSTLSTVALVLMLAVPAGAAEKVEWWDRFALWSACQPMTLVVFGGVSDDASKIGLREADIETTVRSRLRGARIYDAVPPSGDPGFLG